MKLPRVNCLHHDGFGYCMKKSKTIFFGIFTVHDECILIQNMDGKCNIQKKHPRPNPPPGIGEDGIKIIILDKH